MAIGSDECLMRTRFDNPSLSHDVDGICISNGRQPVGNDQRGPVAHQGI
jgi:hypothetical protein